MLSTLMKVNRNPDLLVVSWSCYGNENRFDSPKSQHDEGEVQS